MKRGMARAVEIVEHMKAISERYALEYAAKNPMAAESFRQQVVIFDMVLKQLRSEVR